MGDVIIRSAGPEDLAEIAAMCHQLWPDASIEEHAKAFLPLLAGDAPGKLPAIVLIAQQPAGQSVGFVEVGLRSHADGCNASRPVGYIEGWYVAPACRRRKIGDRLIAAAEEWARRQGCIEMASDTWVDNIESQIAHEALGFEVVDRCVHYRKQL